MRVFLAALACGVCLGGCSNNWKISRRDPESVKDYDYRFDEDDAREVSRAMIEDCLKRPWIDAWEAGHDGKDPLIVLGNVRNKTEDYVNTDLFTSPMQRELLNSGRVRVKAEMDLREELRDERLDTEFNDPETVKAVAKEVNADFMLLGSVHDNKERRADGRAVISYYKVVLELVNLETAEKTWIGEHDIEKRAVR